MIAPGRLGDVGLANRLEHVVCVGCLSCEPQDLSKWFFSNHFGQVERASRQGLTPSGLVRNGEVEQSGARCRCVPDRRLLQTHRQEEKKAVRVRRKTAQMGIQYRSQVRTSQEKIVPMLSCSGITLSSTKVGGKREIRRPRDVAADRGRRVDQVSQRNACPER